MATWFQLNETLNRQLTCGVELLKMNAVVEEVECAIADVGVGQSHG